MHCACVCVCIPNPVNVRQVIFKHVRVMTFKTQTLQHCIQCIQPVINLLLVFAEMLLKKATSHLVSILRWRVCASCLVLRASMLCP